MTDRDARTATTSTHRSKWHRRALLALIPMALLLGGCGNEDSLEPTAVLDQTAEVPYGQRETVYDILTRSLTQALEGYEELGTLDLGSDYFNTRIPDVSYSLEWPASLGVSRLNIVSVWASEDRLLLASKDVSSVCWYVEVSAVEGEPVVRYGASNDAACVASRTDRSNPTWDSFDFPLGAPVPANAGTGAASGGASPTASASGSPTTGSGTSGR